MTFDNICDLCVKLRVPNYEVLQDCHGERPVAVARMVITPELAQYWLTECAGPNRKIAVNSMRLMKNDMSQGDWQLNHQGVAFDIDGVLRDAQHSLT